MNIKIDDINIKMGNKMFKEDAVRCCNNKAKYRCRY